MSVCVFNAVPIKIPTEFLFYFAIIKMYNFENTEKL